MTGLQISVVVEAKVLSRNYCGDESAAAKSCSHRRNGRRGGEDRQVAVPVGVGAERGHH